MAYVNLDLPDNLPESVHTTIRHGLEPLLQDVHWMLAITIGDPANNGPPRQLQVPIAHTLLAATAGISTQLYSGPGEVGVRFKNCIVSFFPWHDNPAKGASEEEAAKILYEVFRNPLVHNLGLNKASSHVVKVGQITNTDEAEERVEELERRADKPGSKPWLVVTEKKRVLWLDPFYWGVRRLVERWSRDADEVLKADQKLTRRLKKAT